MHLTRARSLCTFVHDNSLFLVSLCSGNARKWVWRLYRRLLVHRSPMRVKRWAKTIQNTIAVQQQRVISVLANTRTPISVKTFNIQVYHREYCQMIVAIELRELNENYLFEFFRLGPTAMRSTLADTNTIWRPIHIVSVYLVSMLTTYSDAFSHIRVSLNNCFGSHRARTQFKLDIFRSRTTSSHTLIHAHANDRNGK